MALDLDYLLVQCREGNQLAWEALVRGHQARIYSLAFHYLGNPEEARDATQEIFLKIYRNIDKCREAGMFRPWILKISRNQCIDQLRRKAASPRTDLRSLDEMTEFRDPDPNPEESSIAKSRRRMIHRALQKMTALNKEIVILKDIHGMSLEEIASLLKIPLGTAKSRSNRARLELTQKVLAMRRQSTFSTSSVNADSEEAHELPEV